MKILSSSGPSARVALAIGGVLLVCYLLFSSIGIGLLQERELFNLAKHPDRYGDVAANIASGNGYRLEPESNETMFREPGYIFVVAAVYSVFGEHPTAVRTVNVLFLAVTAWLTYLLAMRVGCSSRRSRLAGLLVLVFPSLVFCMYRVSPEILFSLLCLATLLWMTSALDKPTLRSFCLSGLFLGLTALVRSIVIPFAPVFACYAFYTLRHSIGNRSALVSCAVFCLVFGAVFGGWPLRNYLLSNHLVVTATVSGDAIFQGMYTSKLRDSGLQYHQILTKASKEQRQIFEREGIPYINGFFQAHETVEDELRHSAVLKTVALKEYRAEPWLFVNSVARHVWAFWFKGRTTRSTLVVAVYMLPLLLVAVVGLRRVGAHPNFKITLLFMLTTYLLHLPILAHSRHSVYLVPLLLIASVLDVPGEGKNTGQLE